MLRFVLFILDGFVNLVNVCLDYWHIMHAMPKIGHTPQWQTTHLFWKLDCEQSLFCCEIRLARTRKKVGAIDDWRPCCSQIAASPLIARRSRPLFPRSFQSDFTAKETARSLFENKNLLKNLSSQIFQLSTIFYNNLLSLAWKKLGSHKRFLPYMLLSLKLKKIPNCSNTALRSQELSRFGGGGYSRKFWISVCLEVSWTLTLFKDEANENCPNTKYDTLFKEKQ